MISGVTFIDKFVAEPEALYEHLTHAVQWDERMVARKTASYDLPAGSLIYMTQKVQALWQHAIPKTETLNGRMSLTFRQLK